MSKFDAGDGLCHLVFANDDDVYYLKSLLKLNLRQYLYYNRRHAQTAQRNSMREAEKNMKSLDVWSVCCKSG